MKLKRFKRAPVILAISVLALVCAVRLLQLDFFDRLERMTYDLRMRAAVRRPAPTAANLAFVSIEDSSVTAVQAGRVKGEARARPRQSRGLCEEGRVPARGFHPRGDHLSARGVRSAGLPDLADADRLRAFAFGERRQRRDRLPRPGQRRVGPKAFGTMPKLLGEVAEWLKAAPC